MSEHEARFAINGDYYPLIQNQTIKEYCLIDFRCEESVVRYKSKHMFHVLFLKNFTQAKIIFPMETNRPYQEKIIDLRND